MSIRLRDDGKGITRKPEKGEIKEILKGVVRRRFGDHHRAKKGKSRFLASLGMTGVGVSIRLRDDGKGITRKPEKGEIKKILKGVVRWRFGDHHRAKKGKSRFLASLGMTGGWGEHQTSLGMTGGWGEHQASLGMTGGWGEHQASLGMTRG